MTLRSLLLLGAAGFATAASATPRDMTLPATGAVHLGSVRTVGTTNPLVIAAPVRHPASTPCVVPLYKNAVFGGGAVNFTYTPPAACPGPYGAVVLSVNIGLNAGIQYDRTGTIFIGGVPFWFGTTAEPAPDVAPTWHFERDVTDYSSTLATAQTGNVLIANYTNSTDNSVITSSASLLFYPPTTAFPAPRVPDVVIPLSNPGGSTIALGSTTDVASIAQTLPTNILRASLDLYLQSQHDDEFWYTCVPNSLTGPLEDCGNGAFREGEITVDGTPAGVAPVKPWIYTGGIDPELWSPIPGVQTLDFVPVRVPLSPFAGVLSNGSPHTIGVSVYNADNYFSVAGALLLYLDANATQVTGSVTKNTLAAAPTLVTKSSTSGNGTVVNTSAQHNFTITGTVTGSAGTTTYTVAQTGSFTNNQQFHVTNSAYVQDIQQSTNTLTALTAAGPNNTDISTQSYIWPLNVAINEQVGANGLGKQVTQITQNFTDSGSDITNGTLTSKNYTNNQITTGDTLFINFNEGILTGNTGQASSASFLNTATGYPCYGLKATSQDGVVTSQTTGCN